MRLMYCLTIFAIAIFWGIACEAAQKTSFHVEKITDRIFLLRPEKLWRVNSSNIVYVGNHGLLLVDGQADPVLARQLLKTIANEISRLPILYVVLTHHHMDHIGGVDEIKRYYPRAQVIAHESVNELISSYSGNERRRQVDQWLQPLADAKTDQSRLTTDKALSRKLTQDARELKDYIADIETIRFYPPDITYQTHMTLRMDEDTVNLLHIRSAHTPGDTLIHFPKDKVLVTGDLFHNLDPLFWAEADPDEWLEIMKKITSMDAEVYLGGHGDAIRDKAILTSWSNYIAELITLVKAAKVAGEQLPTLQERINAKDVKSLVDGDYGARIQSWGERLMNFEDTMDAKLDRELEGLWQHY